MLTTGPEEVPPKRVRKLKVIEVKPRRRLWWVGPVAAVFLAFILILNVPTKVGAQDDYTFGTELVNKGSSTSPTEKNTENAVYNSLQEADQYADTIFTATTENVVVGSGGGAAFPGALTTDDASRRTYTEANTAGAATYQILRPSADGSPLTFTPTPAGTHSTCVDETTAGGNGDTDYVTGVANGNEDTYAMSDATGSGDFDVTMWHWSRGITTSSCAVQYGLDIGGTNYLGGTATMVSISYANFSYTWTLNPATTAEWTLAQINALGVYLYMTDANPDTRTTQVGIKITLAPTATYQLDAQITYSGVTSTAQTVSYNVLCQGYRNGDTENVGVYAWNYITSVWNLKTTISAGSDTDYNFDLTSQQRDSGANEVKLRLVDASNGDATQTIAYLDVLKVSRLELGYALDVELTATAVAQYGDITLRIKGYTSAETFKVNVWNYISSSYDLNVLSITSLSNTWQTTVDLNDVNHRSGTNIKIQFLDGIASTSDFVQDTLYLDVVWVTRYHTNPTITLYRTAVVEINVGDSATFWSTYSDYDNEAPTYVYVHVGSTDYSMSANDSDTLYYDGKLYGLVKSDLSAGNTTYYFKVKDASSTDVTTSPVALSVNTKPTVTLDGVTPSEGNPGTYTFFVTYTDADSNSPQYVKATIGGSDYTMTYNGSGGGYHYNKAMTGGTTAYSFKTEDYRSGVVSTTPKNLIVNYLPTLSGFGRAPGDPVYITTELNFTMTFTDLDDTMPTSIKWREDGGATQNVTMVEVDPSDTTTSDGKAYYLLKYLSHGIHYYDFGASDSLYWASGGSNSVTIANRAPTVDNKFVDDHEWRNTYWEYDYAYTDLDGDNVAFQMSTNASFLNINSVSGLVYGTTSDPVGWYDVTVWCNDSYSGSDSDSFVLYVDNREPVITNGPGIHVDQWRNQAWFYDFDFSDADGDSMAWDRSGPTWLTIASDGNLSGTTSDAPGLYSFTVYANDSHTGSDSYSFDIHITNRVPSISSTGNTSRQEGTYLAYQILASDDDGDSLSYALSSNASWATISSAWVNGTAADPGWYEFTIWANDSYSGTDSEHWHLTVEAVVANLPPYFTSSPSLNISRNHTYTYDANATDPEADSLYYDLSTNSTLTINSTTGVLSTLIQDIGSFWVNVTVTDGTTLVWQNFTIDSYNEPPYVITEPPTIVLVGEPYLYWVKAEDNNSDPVIYELFDSPDWLSINPTTGQVQGTPPANGTYDVHIKVCDGFALVWQNYTLQVFMPAEAPTTYQVSAGVILLVAVLAGCMVVIWREA